MGTKIEWVRNQDGTKGESWNPLQDKRKGPSGRGYHCTKCSPGCQHCWAEAMNKRFGNGHPFDDTPVEFELLQSVLEKPLRWRKPRTVAVQLMSDLFHESVPYGALDAIFYTMSMPFAYHPHTYLLLTKRVERMQKYISSNWPTLGLAMYSHIRIGVTMEDQEQVDKRMPTLAECPATVRYASIEPMLSEINLGLFGTIPHSTPYALMVDRLSCVIAGGETGPGARPMYPQWVRSIRDQCQKAGIDFFFKAWGSYVPAASEVGQWMKAGWDPRAPKHGRILDGREWNEMPVREQRAEVHTELREIANAAR